MVASLPALDGDAPSPEPTLVGARRTLVPALIGLAVLVLAVVLLMAMTVVAQRRARDSALGQERSLRTLSQMLEGMTDAETGQRGYLLTGDAAYLTPYDAAQGHLPDNLRQLGELAAASDDPRQRAATAQLTTLAQGKLAELAASIALARGGHAAAAVAQMRDNQGKREMDLLRARVAELRAELRTRRLAAFVRADRLERLLLPLTAINGLGILVLFAVALRAERRRARVQAEAEQAAALREANELARLIARELNHRVKNLFSVVLSIIAISGRKKAPAAEILTDIQARIHALSRAHASRGWGSTAMPASPT
jgi:CHASE3 domain sensor protein